MTVYLLNRDGVFVLAFPTRDEAESFMVGQAVAYPNSVWTIDEYTSPGED